MPERMLNEGEMRFFFTRTIDLDGKVREDHLTWHTLGGNSASSREDFAQRFVDLSEQYPVVRAYHSIYRDDVESKPYIEIARVKDDILTQVQGASSPTDYLHELAHVVQQELLRRNP